MIIGYYLNKKSSIVANNIRIEKFGSSYELLLNFLPQPRIIKESIKFEKNYLIRITYWPNKIIIN